ncbi:transmembrane 9 superfamily member 4-like [Branchiostoma floridae]|uniref:Transmembrane 9 superfamily member 4-like n=1 Tax=Branchiostoma floridae TaxID=7739 RepID=A0A9J7MTY8_BRAFL|nr:transmembrane 9 superfamily member 4-like [Branchiostoma floridae]
MLDTGQVMYEHGYRIGYVVDNVPYINNHLKLVLHYHTEDEETFRVVGFEVEPRRWVATLFLKATVTVFENNYFE